MFVTTRDDAAKRVPPRWWEVDLLCFCCNLDEGGSDILQLSAFDAVVGGMFGVAGGAAEQRCFVDVDGSVTLLLTQIWSGMKGLLVRCLWEVAAVSCTP
jgi:hypothetical protein